ncbi:MAG: DUF3160 domain-containing protein [Ignavibacteriae bacterium]|nr:DUF3160 domain-containing protein [Ignavibacteriota bacterium]
MRYLMCFAVALALLIFASYPALTQGSPPFNIDQYRLFLQNHPSVSASQLMSTHPAGMFANDLNVSTLGIPYLDSIDARYHLTQYERQLLRRHSFLVTERLKRESFGQAFDEIYHADLPVFISSDAILHAVHMSYDKILKDAEWRFLIPWLDSLLTRLHSQMPALAARYAGTPAMLTSLRDVDVYLTVPRILLGRTITPYYPENTSVVNTLLQHVYAEQGIVEYPLFGTATRKLDFSQFKPRGHYTGQNVPPEYAKYFRAMMWLGRMEIYLIAPQSAIPPVPEADVQRQTIDAALIREAAEASDAFGRLEDFDSIIRMFVGESDNVTLPNIRSLLQSSNVTTASQLLNLQRFRALQDSLRRQSYAWQLIMSQLLMRAPFSPDSITPASAFLLVGQRFVVDSYVTSNVVYDRVPRPFRGLPSTLDILFALGNNATAQLLQGELTRYPYGRNLAGLRYLIDAYQNDFWNGTMYNGWLNSIRKLNPPLTRDSLPAFMRTAAWWQEKMNTQLASWAQLRHDNLLYAKQSYTGMPICSFPESYVEPFPQFYDALKVYAQLGATRFQQPPFNDAWIAQYFTQMVATIDTLGSISRKELSNTTLSPDERGFLQRMLRRVPFGCSPDSVLDGWYPRLYYRDMTGGVGGVNDRDIIVADVHTCPADAGGGIVGWVLHGGTGPLNLGVWIANKPGGAAHAYIGPVLSYYEHVSANFHRLTDEEWTVAYNLPPSFRPSFVNLYLADSTGNSRGSGINLITGADNAGGDPVSVPTTPVLYQNYPNPFNPSTLIAFTIPAAYANASVELSIFNVQGELVQTLVKSSVPAGNYIARWDGRNASGNVVASGVYLYRLEANGFAGTKKLILIR